MENYQVNSNVDVNDNFMKQLKPEKLYNELRKLILELEDKILGNELKWSIIYINLDRENLDPIVFLLDLDGTMIGNIQPQIDEYYIIKR